jgi:hypothetical protein
MGGFKRFIAFRLSLFLNGLGAAEITYDDGKYE